MCRMARITRFYASNALRVMLTLGVIRLTCVGLAGRATCWHGVYVVVVSCSREPSLPLFSLALCIVVLAIITFWLSLQFGRTPLHGAACVGKTSIVQALLSDSRVSPGEIDNVSADR